MVTKGVSSDINGVGVNVAPKIQALHHPGIFPMGVHTKPVDIKIHGRSVEVAVEVYYGLDMNSR